MILASQLNDSINLKLFESDVIQLFSPVLLFLEKELSKIRTNRAHPSLIEDTKVFLYGGQEVAILKHIALITVSEATTLLVQPFDVGIIVEIEKALSQSDSGLNPKSDGKLIKIVLPSMSKERRLELSKTVSKKKDESIIQIRKIRQDILNEIKKAEKNKQISQDFNTKLQKSLQCVFDKISDNFDILCKKKEQTLNE
jgi:ribosome recycling factor